MNRPQPYIRYDQPHPDEAEWCEVHQNYSLPWKYESEFGGYLCPNCMDEWHDYEDED